MTRHRCCAAIGACVALLLLTATHPVAQTSSLSALVERLRAANSLPAVGGATFSSAGTPQVAVAGQRKLGADAQVTVDDLWHIGSISKSFTSALVGKFVERTQLSWTSTMTELMGERAGAFGGVTMAHLLGHRAGIPANVTPALMATASQGAPPLVELRRRIATETFKGTPAGSPGAVFLYSNLGYVIAASILEDKTGKAWEDLIRAEVLEPMGLRSAGMGPPGVLDALTQPRGHRNGTLPVEPGLLADNFPYLGPAGRLHMSLTDLAAWGQAHLKGERGQDVAILKADTVAHLHQPLSGGNYALGWVNGQTTSGKRVVWHNGSNTMWYAVVMFDPAADRGIVLTTNGGIGAAQALDTAARAWLQ